jgi:hypothetical protein
MEAKAGSVMCAYNSVNGQPACVNQFLLQDQLRGKWGFQGYVVSDCEAIINIFRNHHFTRTQPEASALAVQRGVDNECIDFAKATDDHDYKPYLEAYQQGILNESEIDTALVRLFTARMKLGMFDPPEVVPYSKIDEKELDTAEHRALARVLARESMVLLKNDGTLPLKQGALKIALVGPLADQTRYLLGNYNGVPTHTVSVLEGIRTEFPQAQISFVPGTQFLRNDGGPVPASALTTSEGQPGLKLEFATGEIFEEKPTVFATRYVIVAVGALLTPISCAILSPENYLRYRAALHIPPVVAERQNNGPLPQYFADEFGGENMVQQVARVYSSLSPEDRARTAIFCNSWGKAAAIDFFGARYGLPRAISYHNNYWYWGPRDYTGDIVIVLGSDGRGDREFFQSVEAVGRVEHPYSRRDAQFTLWLCRGLNQNLRDLWPKLKRFD